MRKNIQVVVTGVAAILGIGLGAIIVASCRRPDRAVEHPAAEPGAVSVAPLESLPQSQRRLIRELGHDLRSPLASIVSMSEGLQEGDFGTLSDEQAYACGLMVDTARRLVDRTEVLYALADEV
ncbi:MAG: histidine kinase dimerization/phospho-acceptor domain-containing protein [Actinomycetes bacterium]